MEYARITWLAERYIRGLADLPEQQEFLAWVREEKDESLIREVLGEQWQKYDIAATLPAAKADQLFYAVMDAARMLQEEEPPKVRPLLYLKRWAVAAAVIIAIASIAYFIIPNRRGGEGPAPVATTDIPALNRTKATITLADGRTIALDSLTTITQNGVTLIKDADGKLVYDSRLPTPDSRLIYNTLSNPRGSKVIDMILADGSHVWLNAGSSITYPVAFLGNERKVSINGEAYFEISRQSTVNGKQLMTFIVEKGDMQVTVLGTKFNVNAYDDEADIRVTLIEGSVKASLVNGPSAVLKPGEQAGIDPFNHSQFTVHHPDLDAVMAWYNNEFIFEDDDLAGIMRQLSRWYDIEVTGAALDKTRYTGRITRSVPISQVLRMFEQIGRVKFEINNKKVNVVPIK